MIKSHNRINFGKYRGMAVEDIARIDPSYIWYLENRGGHQFTPRVKRVAREAADYQYHGIPPRRDFY